MVIVNKILNVLIFLLAIAACIASILLNSRRQELRLRADHLQSVAISVADKLPGSDEDETGTGLDTSYVNKKNLDWKAFHVARKLDAAGTASFDDYENLINKLPGQVEELRVLKEKMALQFKSFANTIKYKGETEEGYLGSLNHMDSFEDNAKPVVGKVKMVTDRAVVLSAYLEKLSQALGHAQDLGNFDIYAEDDNKEGAINEALTSNLNDMQTQATQLMNRKNLFAKGYKRLTEAFNEDPDKKLERYYQPEFENFDPNSDADTITAGVEQFYEDLKKVNLLLHERVIVKKSLEAERRKLAQRDTTIEELNKENDGLKNENGRLAATKIRLTKKVEQLQIALGQGKTGIMPKNLIAQVSQVDSRFDFVVLNKGLVDKVTLNGELLIHSNNKFICKVRVTKVLKNSCVCDIMPTTRPKFPEGHVKAGEFLMPVIGDEAVVPGI